MDDPKERPKDLHTYKITHPNGRVEYKGDMTWAEWKAGTWQAKVGSVLIWIVLMALLLLFVFGWLKPTLHAWITGH